MRAGCSVVHWVASKADRMAVPTAAKKADHLVANLVVNLAVPRAEMMAAHSADSKADYLAARWAASKVAWMADLKVVQWAVR